MSALAWSAAALRRRAHLRQRGAHGVDRNADAVAELGEVEMEALAREAVADEREGAERRDLRRPPGRGKPEERARERHARRAPPSRLRGSEGEPFGRDPVVGKGVE